MAHEHDFKTDYRNISICYCGEENPDQAPAVADVLAKADETLPVDEDAEKVERDREKRKASTIRERFTDFHVANPNVYDRLVSESLSLKARGVKQVGIALIYERMRWLVYFESRGAEEFKLSNDFRAEYARLIMQNEPELQGFFKLRSLRRAA